jgi:hypothetical protein
VWADVNYVRNPPATPDGALEFVTEDESRSTMETRPGRPVWVTDARGATTDLDREGFVLVPHRSGVADFDRIQEDAAVDQRYVEEMAAVLTEVTGAVRVFMLGNGKKRYGESAVEKWRRLANAKPARYPHADNTDRSATGMVEMIASFVPDLDLADHPRWALYNLWRAITPPPQDVPLAVCDARTVSTGDEVTVTALTVERGAGDIRHDTTGYVHSPRHRWHYFRDMTPDEVLVFKAHDTDPARSCRVPHTAFDDPSCPPGTPTRASVEIRGLALFA